MSITYPTFKDKEIPSPEKFNNFVQSIEAKFTAGLGTAEIQWPLIAGGNLIMGEYEITGATKIMKVVNASAYSTLQLALTAGSGGIVYIPPGTTIQADGAQLIGTTCAIVGAGPTSVLKLSDTPSAGYFLRNETMGLGTQCLIANLMFDGNAAGGGNGLVLRNMESGVVHNCWFKNWAGDALALTSGAGSGDACENIRVTNCEFVGGSDHHIHGDSCDNVIVKGCISENCDTQAFEFVAGDSSSLMRRISIVDNIVVDCDEEMIRVLGGSGTPNAIWANVIIQDNHLDGTGGGAFAGISLGGAAAVIEGFRIAGNIILNSLDDGIVVTGNDGIVSDNVVESCGSDAVKIADCARVKVCDNMLANATDYGVATDNADECQVHDNDVSGGGVQLADTNATFIQYANQGQVGIAPANAFANMTVANATGGTPAALCTVTIPANFLQIGDVLTCHGAGVGTGTADVGSLKIRIDGNNVASAAIHTALSAHVTAKIVVTHSTTVQYIGLGSDETVAIDVGASTYGSIDLTSAIDLDLYADPGATNTISGRGLIVEVTRTELQ